MKRVRRARSAIASCLIAAGTLAVECAAQSATEAAVGSGAAASSSDAMRRAERMANNPMRAIIEAGRLQRRGSAEPSPEALATATKPTPSSSPIPAVALLTATGALDQPVAGSQGFGSLQAPVLLMLPAHALPQPDALAAPLASPVQPQLLSKVDPVIPPRVLAEIGDVSTVWFDLSLRADGTVATATLVAPAPRQLQRLLGPILEQWRYAALPAPQIHRVELAFTSP